MSPSLLHHTQELADLDSDHNAQRDNLEKAQKKERSALKRSHRLQVLESEPAFVSRSTQVEEHPLNNQVAIMGKLLKDLLLYLAESIYGHLRGKVCPRRITVKTFLPQAVKKSLLLFSLLKGKFPSSSLMCFTE